MRLNQIDIQHLKAQMAQALEVLADHEKRLLLQEGKYSHASQMKKKGLKAVDD